MSTAVHTLISPDAGRGRARRNRSAVLDDLARTHDVIDISGPSAEASERAARAAVADGAERLIVIGGDGIVHLGVQATARTDTILGVVPVGTGNDFARAFGSEPGNTSALAARALASPRTIDLLQVGDNYVASVLTTGFSGDVNVRANRIRFPRGPSRYTVATILELPHLKARRIVLTIDGQKLEYDAAMLAVANTGWFGGGMQICPDADPNDGLLDVTVVADVGRIELLRFFRRVFSGNHLSHPKVHSHRGSTVEIDAADLSIWGDGEAVGDGPANCQVARHTLKLAI